MMLRQPLWLLLLFLVIPYLLLAFRRTGLKGLSPLGRYSRQSRTWRTLLWWLPEALAAVFFGLWVFLLAGPEKAPEGTTQDVHGLSVVIALDRSGSMGAQIPQGDQYVSRLEGVKQVTRDFLSHRPNDKFSLVAFARYPETHTPLTDNHQVLADFLDLIDLPKTQDEDGTALGDAVVLSVGRLAGAQIQGQGQTSGDKNSADKPGLVIILTDGQNNCGTVSPEDASTLAAQNGVTVYTIGLGGEGVMMVDTPMGPQARGMGVNLDERGLKALAERTGGRYFRADTLQDLGSLYDEIAKRETRKLAVQAPAQGELDLNAGLLALLILALILPLVRDALLQRVDP